MKKCTAIIAVIILVLCFTACGKQDAESAGTNKEIPKHHEIVTEATFHIVEKAIKYVVPSNSDFMKKVEDGTL